MCQELFCYRSHLLAMFTKTPVDQPETEGYAVMHEDFVFKAGEAFAETVREFLDKEPVVPLNNA